MDRKTKIETLVAGAGKKARGLLDAAIQSADQNADGKFNLTDVSVIAESIGNAVKKNTQAMKENAEERARLAELKSLQPIFCTHVDNAVALDDADFALSKFVHITERDERRAKSEVCKGAIGYMTVFDGFRVVNIYRDSVEEFGLTFYPNSDCDVYYVDPTDRDHYIALDDYFDYLKSARINELKKIAQDLGAKHYKITFREEKTSFKAKRVTANASMTGVGGAQADHSSSAKEFSRYEVESEAYFPGHAPVSPQLRYLNQNLDIKNLVAMRMDPTSPLIKEKYVLNLSQSSGIKMKDASKIDAVLKGLKCSGNATVTSEVQNESRRSLEYDIEF